MDQMNTRNILGQALILNSSDHILFSMTHGAQGRQCVQVVKRQVVLWYLVALTTESLRRSPVAVGVFFSLDSARNVSQQDLVCQCLVSG